MKADYLIPLILIIGIAVLFFFPNPESNFIPYVGTALFFGIAIGLLIIRRRKRK